MIGCVLAPRGGLISAVTAKPPEARRSRRLTGFPGVTGPQVLVAALPVVQPRALAPAPVVDRAVQQSEVTGPFRGGRAVVGVDPDAAAVRVHLARAVRAHSPARAVAQFLRAAHRAHVPGDGQRTLAAHPAAEHLCLRFPLRAGEQRAGRALSLDPGREPAVAGVRPQDLLQPVGHAGAQARMDRNWRRSGHALPIPIRRYWHNSREELRSPLAAMFSYCRSRCR